jgi:hypothetical protein
MKAPRSFLFSVTSTNQKDGKNFYLFSTTGWYELVDVEGQEVELLASRFCLDRTEPVSEMVNLAPPGHAVMSLSVQEKRDSALLWMRTPR